MILRRRTIMVKRYRRRIECHVRDRGSYIWYLRYGGMHGQGKATKGKTSKQLNSCAMDVSTSHTKNRRLPIDPNPPNSQKPSAVRQLYSNTHNAQPNHLEEQPRRFVRASYGKHRTPSPHLPPLSYSCLARQATTRPANSQPHISGGQLLHEIRRRWNWRHGCDP